MTLTTVPPGLGVPPALALDAPAPTELTARILNSYREPLTKGESPTVLGIFIGDTASVGFNVIQPDSNRTD